MESLEDLLDEDLDGGLRQRLDREFNKDDGAVHVLVWVLRCAHTLPAEIDEVQFALVLLRGRPEQGQTQLLDQRKLIVSLLLFLDLIRFSSCVHSEISIDRVNHDLHSHGDDLRREVPNDRLEEDGVLRVIRVNRPNVLE